MTMKKTLPHPDNNFSKRIKSSTPLKNLMRQFLLVCLFVITVQLGYSEDFITEWTFSQADTELHFSTHTDGDVNYTWSAAPSGNSGSGTFNQPFGSVELTGLTIEAGDVVTLEIAPENLERFYIANGTDRLLLTNVVQWGDVSWTSMRQAFHGCSNLEVTASDTPDLSNVTNISRMFSGATSFNSDIGNWDVANVTDMSRMFDEAESFNQDIGGWNVSSVEDMVEMFKGALVFNQDIGDWNVSNVTDMNFLFTETEAFNQDLNDWDVSGILELQGLFLDAVAFNENIGSWDVSNVVITRDLFNGALAFNQDIGDWDVSNVNNMEHMFANTASFNQDIGGWDVSSVVFMLSMFENAAAFNQDIGSWDVTSVEEMIGMFRETGAFNQDIGDWDVSNVESMGLMFESSVAFNQDISGWDVSNVTSLLSMFEFTESFNQSVGDWILYPTVNLGNFFRFSSIDCDHYTATLVGFRNNNPTVMNRQFVASDVEYGTEAVAFRDSLISAQGWTITGDELSGNECGSLLSVESLAAENKPLGIFPNPAKDKVVIEGLPGEMNQVALYNALGREVTTATTINRTSHKAVTVDLSGLKKGVYFIKTPNQSGSVVKY